MLDLKKLEVFLKVYETGSFSKASKLLYLAQPTITLHIKDLEEALGVTLFDRHTRKVIPSKAGKIVYEYGKEILNILKRMQKELQPFKDEKGGLVEIGGSTIPGQYILPRVIKNFKEKYPYISVFLKVGDSQEIAEKVMIGELELGMIGATFKTREIVYTPCYQDEIVLIAPPQFSKDEVELSELYKIPLIKREEGSGSWKNAVETLQKAGIDILKLNITGEMGSTEAVKEAVKAGLGCGFVSFLAIEIEKSLKLLKVIKIKKLTITRNFYLVYPKYKNFTPASQIFLNFIKNYFNLT